MKIEAASGLQASSGQDIPAAPRGRVKPRTELSLWTAGALTFVSTGYQILKSRRFGTAAREGRRLPVYKVVAANTLNSPPVYQDIVRTVPCLPCARTGEKLTRAFGPRR